MDRSFCKEDFKDKEESNMKKIALIGVVAAFVTIFLGATVGTASAAQGSFTFASSLAPVLQNGVNTFNGSINYTPTFNLTATTATLFTTYTNGDYDVFLNGNEILSNGQLVESVQNYFVFASNGATFLAGTQPGLSPGSYITTGSYTAPAPEASSILGFGSLLLAGGLVLFAAKRRTA
jgi:heme A synthase